MFFNAMQSGGRVVVLKDPMSSWDLTETLKKHNGNSVYFVVVVSNIDNLPVIQEMISYTNLRSRNISVVPLRSLQRFLSLSYFPHSNQPTYIDMSSIPTQRKTTRWDHGNNQLGELSFQCFAISLLRRKDRFMFMMDKTRHIGLNINVFEATDGLGVLRHHNTSMRNGAFGLYATYKRLLKLCIDKNYDRVLILEDDIYFHKRFNEMLLSAKKIILENNVVYLGYNQKSLTCDQMTDTREKRYFSLSKDIITYGTFAIMLDSSAIRALYNDISQYMQPVDIVLHNTVVYNNLKNAVLYPPLVIPEVRESDNMGVRNLDIFLQERGMYSIKNNYRDIHKFSSFIKSNDSVRSSYFEKADTMFVFVIASYNNSDWVERNMQSIVRQTYTKWRIVYVDDASLDSTVAKVSSFVRSNNIGKKCTIIQNKDRNYQAYSRWKAYSACHDDEVCILLDGDDWLYTPYALEHLNELYKKKKMLVTYGQFIYWDNNEFMSRSGHKEFPYEVVRKKSYRKHEWISSHLRTAKASVLKTIRYKDLLDSTGNYFKICTDMLEMFYALERCYGRHCNSGEVLCVYNQQNSKRHPLSYYNRSGHLKYRQQIEAYIRNL